MREQKGSLSLSSYCGSSPEVVIPPADGPVELAVRDLDRVEQRVEAVVEGALHVGDLHADRNPREEA